jgi:hypothetical protein
MALDTAAVFASSLHQQIQTSPSSSAARQIQNCLPEIVTAISS